MSVEKIYFVDTASCIKSKDRSSEYNVVFIVKLIRRWSPAVPDIVNCLEYPLNLLKRAVNNLAVTHSFFSAHTSLFG